MDGEREAKAGDGHVRFAILCLGRTGSTHLVALLDSHPRIRCFGELLNPKHPKATDEGAFALAETDDPVAHVRSMLAARPGVEAIGFKLPLESIRAFPRAAELLTPAEGIALVRLRRRNLLELLVSRRLLRATLVSQSTAGSYGDARIAIPPAEALAALERIEAEQRELDELGAGCPAVDVTYEEIAAGARLEEIQRFLGVEPAPLDSPLKRLRVRSLDQTIENWGEVREAVAGSRFAEFVS